MSPLQRNLRLLGEVLLILVLAEFGIMLLLSWLAPGIAGLTEAVVDAALLACLTTPLIFWRASTALRHQAASTEPSHADAVSRRRALAMALGAQVLGLALTGGLLHWKMQDAQQEQDTELQWRVGRLSQEIERRFTQPLYGLRGLRATYASTSDMTHAEFRRWVLNRNLPVEFPGIRGFGFIERVPRAHLDAYLQIARQEIGPEFQVRTQGQASDLLVIRHIEPFENNRAALGFDIGSEPRRREAAERAIHSGQPALTERVELVQDSSKTPGFLYLLPVYSTDTPSPDTLRGLVYVPIVARELLEGATAVAGDLVDFAIYDGPADADHLVYRSTPHAVGPAEAQASTTYLAVGGRNLTLQFWPSPLGVSSMQKDSTLLVMGGVGALASTLLAAAIWLLGQSQQRAQRLAQAMTQDIQRLNQVANHTQDAVVILDPTGHITWVNEAFRRMRPDPTLPLLGQHMLEMPVFVDGTDEARATLTHLLEQGKAGTIALSFTARSGRVRYIDAQFTPFQDERGQLAGFIGVGSDITELKSTELRLQAALRSSQALLTTVETHAIVSFSDRHGTITDVNQSFCAVSGYSKEELVGQNHRIVNSGEHPPAFWSEMWGTISSGRPWRGEICNRRKDGALYWVDSMIAPFIGDDGLVERYVSIRTEITERKANEAALLQATHRLELAVEGSNEGLWDWMDIGQDAQWWSPSYYRLLGYTPQELPARASSFRDLLHPDSVEPNRRMLDAALANSAEFNLEVQLRTGSGAYRWFHTRAKVYRDSTGQPRRMAGATQDVTERRQAQTQLEQAMHAAQAATVAKGQFLANMSHELRTPMNAVLGMLSLLDNTELNAQQEDYLRKSRSAAESLLTLLNDILDLSKVDAGKMELDPQPTPLDPFLQDLSVLLSAYVGKKPVELLFDIDPALPDTVRVDANRLRQVLINLAGNAVKFTEQGNVVVRLALLERLGERVRIAFSVSDSGIGISAEQQARLFQSFSQAEASTTRRFGGTGLGLAISQQLVQLMGGKIGVDSQVGRGSTFHFTLDMVAVADAEAATAQPAQQALHVLLVEDNALARQLTEAMCAANGWQCTAVDSGEAALALLEASPQGTPPHFDAVLMDWNLPGIDGWQTAARLRALAAPSGTHTPPTIIMVTANARRNLDQLSAQDQVLVNGYLVKPVTAHMLRDAVLNRAEGRHRVRQSRRNNASHPLRGLHILVVEDNLINQQVAEELLSAQGARVSLAANGRAGVEAIAAASPPFDLVLMDIQMPVMDGYAATAYVRQQLQLPDLPIVGLSANAMASDRAECLAAGMNDHIGKPFDLHRLVALILRLTGRTAAPDDAPAAAQASTNQNMDLPAALERMGGKKDLFLRSAQEFAAQLGQHAPQLREQLARGDLAAARMLLHTLKGTSALVGCFALSRQAAQLESQAQRGDTAGLLAALEPLDRLLAQTGTDLAVALAALGGTARPDAAPPPSTALSDAARQALERLAPLLHAEDFGALECYAEQRVPLESLPATELADLDAALQALEFSRAHGIVQTLLAHEDTSS
ncbi:CHASE domain-containing protein [Curvibacter sp. APW13]|uniref:CHASE domain-containing hybrid sensor histidine kinase/response regulator n=1 Tax=Curvibacter sp. APW13 TaxID=3077236 RepID=UPI0028DF248D|nr:CHASE domain-containing protein [Curvibacter sp. APW13]MDT8989637.1 CHASE domain-containing protein [Curvibacter sp. APW13]